MSSKAVSVEKLYTEWIYPPPVDDMASAISNGYYEYSAPHLFTPILWPSGKNIRQLDILIAGCGTNQAAYQALTLPNSRITAIDISESSLKHSKYLQEKHNLENIEHHKMSLLDIEALGKDYDLITCGGVLHHLQSPDQGLRALKRVLRSDGVMSLMLYGSYLRYGVYLMQEVFRRLDFSIGAKDVDLVKKALRSLSGNHPVNNYLRTNPEDLLHDSGIVDTFLHPQDKSYSVSDVFTFIRSNELEFFNWIDRGHYSATCALEPDSPLIERILLKEEKEQWELVELLVCHLGTHRFLCGHPEQLKKRCIDFKGDEWLAYVPVIRPPAPKVLDPGDLMQNRPAKLKRDWHEFFLHRLGINLFKKVDGIRSISAIVTLAKTEDINLQISDVRAFFKTMYDWGHLMYFNGK